MVLPHAPPRTFADMASSVAYTAFLEVLSRKQTGYGTVISWLQGQHTRHHHDE